MSNYGYGYQSAKADPLVQGLLIDIMEDEKAFELIFLALDLITGIRPKDFIHEYINAGKVLDSVLISKMLYLDHLVNVTAAEIIQTLVQYRAHSSQKNSVIERIISGKRYQGPIYNAAVREAKSESNDYVRRLLHDLVRINTSAIDILKREAI